MPRLISRSIDSGSGSSQPSLSLTTLILVVPSACLPTNWSPKPNFLANAIMIVWSGFDSNSGSITFSRHCSERFDAVTEPEVSNCVHAGSR